MYVINVINVIHVINVINVFNVINVINVIIHTKSLPPNTNIPQILKTGVHLQFQKK